MPDSFYELFHAWHVGDQADDGLEAQLVAMCDEAWDSGDFGDRTAVMTFICLRRDVPRFHRFSHLLVAGNDLLLGVQALGYIAWLAGEGYRFDEYDRDAIAEFGARVPAMRSFARYVLDLLRENDSAAPST